MANARPDLDALQALLDKNPHDGTDAAQADAERYRWLRAAQSQTARNWIVINNRNMYGEHELDAAIDAARKA